MATQATNNITRSVSPKSIFESAKAVISSAVTINQGDLVAFDTSSHILKAVTATSDAANFLGVAKQTLVSGKLKSPYQGTAVDAAQALEDVVGPAYGVIVKLKATASDAMPPGCPVYLTATDAQTITSVDPGSNDSIGIYQGANIASASAGQLVEIFLGARYGQASLSF